METNTNNGILKIEVIPTISKEFEQLETVVKNSGLQIQEGEEIKASYLPFLNQLADIHEQANKINYDNPTVIDELIARDLRLSTVKIRTGSSKLKDERKRIYLLRGNLEQASYNLIAASCALTEDTFLRVEKFQEIKENKRKADLKALREIELLPFIDFCPTITDLGGLSDAEYANVLKFAKQMQAEKIEADKQAEIERLKAIQDEADEKERVRLEILELKKQAEIKEKELQAEREKAEKERIELELKAAADLKESTAKHYAEMEKAAEKLKAEQIEKDKLQTELDLKAETERKQAEQVKADNLKQLEIERKNSMAPDKEKLVKWIESLTIKGVETENLKQSSQLVAINIFEKFEGFKNWALTQIATL
jgi:hypothetical protein